MMLMKVVALFCAMALGIAFLADSAIFACGRIFDSFAIAAKPSGWTVIILTLWIAAFAVGLFVVKHFHIFPFIGPK